MKVYVLIDNEDNILSVDNLKIVLKQEDAERMIRCGQALAYETVDVLNSVEVDEIYKRDIGRGWLNEGTNK